MTNDILREFITFCALGSLLEDTGIAAEDVLTPDELGRIEQIVSENAATMTESEADVSTIETAKVLLRESLDRLLAVETTEPPL